ncbi:MAG: 4a-hydroxytetrahydrobiopterin dehydratase [Candidatus Kapabacteria bacterium]|nr:4a-hydroxytetrahydrobiopterin dehydratase [Candidatus Kapabacteria bacterium]
MPRPELLSERDIAYNLEKLPNWQLVDSTVPPSRIVREASAPNFVAAIGAINAIAVLAEAADHHPDILLYGWNKLRITLSTHDRGGLTELDFALATKIDELGLF